MAAEVSAGDLNVIHDEDVLRRMWQQTDDFGRKKEIRQRMYKLREQRLKDFYTGEDSLSITMASRKHAAPTHADSISDQGGQDFMALKSKEIRDSESPTRDIHRRQGDNNYWNTIQESSYSTQGDDGGLRQSYERTSTGTGQSVDGRTQTKLEADERGFTSSNTTETDKGRTMADEQHHDAQIATSSHTKTDNGDAYNYSTSQEHHESKSSVTEGKDQSSAFKSTKWETSSTSSSSRKVVSSSNYRQITSDGDLKALTSGDEMDFATTRFLQDDDYNTSTIRRAKNDSRRQQSEVRYSTEDQTDSSTFIDKETRNNIKNNLKDIQVDIREDHFGKDDSRRGSSSTYTTEVSSNVDDYIANNTNTSRNVSKQTKTDDRSNVVVDQKIMSEIHKLDSFLSTQNTPGTTTPVSPHSVMGEVNWTVVSNNDGEFIYRDERSPGSPGSRSTPIKHPDNLDLPKECTEGQYVTTYNEHYTTKRISMDVSPTHDAFARSLRQTPPGTPRSLSRQSLDRSSPERKTKNSPRSSPDKERRTSVGSYTVDKPANVRRKTSEVTRQTTTSKDSSLKTKRKFSTTQTKAAAKARNSTPGTSPSTSPSRKQKERSDSPSSASDSDASQVTYDKRSTTSTYTRSDVVRRNLMDTFDKDSPKKTFTSTETITKSSSRPSSPEKSPTRKSPNDSEKKPTGILRKDSRSDSNSTVVTVSSNVTEHKLNASISSRVRDKSPEYSSEGSVSKEIKNTQRKSSPDSSPERSAFTPIKQFRTSPEMSSDTMKVTVTETDQPSVITITDDFINQENLSNQNNNETIKVDIYVSKGPEKDKRLSSPDKQVPSRKTSAQRTPERRTPSPTKTRSQSPVKHEINVTRKESFSRKLSSKSDSSPSKVDEKSGARSPSKSPSSRKPSLADRSPSPNKNVRSISPTKGVSRKPSLQTRSSSPKKEEYSRSPSPDKHETVTMSTTKTIVTRRSSYDAPTKTSSRRSTPSPVKDNLSSRSPSPNKESPMRKTSSPIKSKSPSPQRGNKRSRQQSTSPSVSPCSSPERTTERKSERTKVIRKTSGSKVDSETVRTTRRSSIPRADQSTVVRKTVETKIEIRSKPTTKIPSSTSKTRIAQSPVHRNVRTDSQSSLDRQTTTKSTYSTTINRTTDKTREPVKKMSPNKKIVTTTAVISLQRPNNTTPQSKQTISNAASKTTLYKRTSSKEITPKKADTNHERKPVTTTTKRVASRTNTPKSKPTQNYDEVDKTTKQSNRNENLETQTFIEQLRKDEMAVHGYKDETINLEIEDNDLENETRPDLFPETEDDEENPEKQNEDTTESTNQISEKTINVDSKRKVASQFMVTIKKPTATTPSRVGAKPITTRSSSGPVKGSPQTAVKTSIQQRQTSTVTSKRQITSSVQKSDSLNMIRTSSDKNVAKSSTQRRQMSKPEMSTTKPNQASAKITSPKQVAETGIASKNITTPKSATLKRVVSNKNKLESPISSSEDEDDNIPSVVTPNQQEQQYIEELEEMRRNEEMEYAAKLTATNNQENQLLSVIVQHPKSSRESSPDFSNKPQPYCTVSDDGGATPRYADLISEPEDVEVFDSRLKPKFENYSQKQPRVEQVTDLDEESEAEDFKLNVSVADRARHFIEASQNHIAGPIREEPETPVDSSKNVLKAKTMFETIANNQKAPPAPGNKPVDILSRPSVFEARRGQTAPKPLPSDAIPRESSFDQIQRRASVQLESTEQEFVEDLEENDYDNTQVHVNKATTCKSPSPSPVKDSPAVPEKKPDSPRRSTTEKPTVSKPEAPVKQPNQTTPKADPTSRMTKSEPTNDRKKPDTSYKPKPFEKTISATAEISSKRAFFERKAQAQNSPVKETKPFVPLKERKPLTDYIQNKENIRGSSPTRKTSQTTSFIENERKSARVSPERKVSTPSPVKDRKPSLKSESPERRISITKSVKERRSSFTKEDETITQTSILQKKDSFSKSADRKVSPSRSSPERRAPITEKNFPDHSSRTIQKVTTIEKVPSSPVKDRKPSFTRESPERVPQRKSSRGSPERAPKSPDRASPSPKNEKEPAELNKAGKFGVTLRRTSSTTSAGTPRRLSIPGESQEIEDVNDVELLEIMMEKAVGYEQRRRIRAQIRVAKKAQETTTKTTTSARQKSPTRSPTRDYKGTQEPAAKKAPTETRRPSSPTKSVSVETKRTVVTESVRKPSLERASPPPQAASPQRKESVPEQKSPGYQRPTESFRRTSKTDHTEVTSSVRSGKSGVGVTLVETGVDSVTSSYGVGPTDENGRPLFGLRALRRSNTGKQLTDEVKAPEVKKEEPLQEPVCDARGRPLFGGLKALRAATTTTTTTTTTTAAAVDTPHDDDDMPEQTGSAQLQELVQRHEKVVRETNGPQDQPRQKPKARLRDSFILQEEDQSVGSQLNNSLGRGASLKSLIQRHETIATNGGAVRSEMESSHTVVTSRSLMGSDGSVSVTRDVVQGELSAKNGEEPAGQLTRTQYSYQNAGGDDKGVSRVTTTTTALGDRDSGSQRRSSLKSTKRSSVTEEITGRKSVETVRKGSLRRSPCEDEDSPRRNDRVSRETYEDDTEKVKSSRVSTAAQKFTSSTTTRQTESRTKTASPSLRRQKSSEEESSGEDKRKTIVRGDSVRALQHKFQQATENAVNSAPRSQAPRAGLILRTSSFNTSQDHDTVSSTLKQSTSLSADKKGEVLSTRRDSQDSRRDSIPKSTGDVTSRRESVTREKDGSVTTRVTETSTSSFLDNTSRVTGVQDILTRMRNADLVSESGDTEADREARALLNKFLGASVILQGMEQGMRAGATPDATPGSAALVRTVEKQRVATTRQKEEDIENIWDEQVLKTLLEQCTDYEGRRTLRARLRTVMAEHKACADLVALTGDNASQHAETETKQVTMSNDGGSVTRTEVTTRTSTNRLTKANSVSSPFAKFRQLERQNSAPSVGQAGAPLFKITDPRVARSASSIKDRLLSWVQAQTREYKNIQIENFSTSWNNGLAFCALIHHFCPNAFDYDKLTPEHRRHNFELAFRVAEEEADIAPLLDVEDMVVMRRPDWKCVFTYVQSVYRRFHSTPEAVRC